MGTELRALRRRLACWAAVLGLCSSSSGSAWAYHTEEEHLTDETAWTMAGDKAWRIGLYKAAVGLGDRVVLGTFLWPWAGRTPNAYLKWRFYGGDAWHWAVQGGFFRLDSRAFDPRRPQAILTVFSGSLLQSVRLGAHHQLSNGLAFTGVQARGSLDQRTLRGVGEGALTNIQYVGNYELRLSRTVALVVTGRYLLAQVLSANTSFTAHPDEFTTVNVFANAEDDSVVNFRNAFSIVPSVVWSWQSFNLELGFGYGNFNVPGVNFVVNERTLVPNLDFYWTF